jgi:hypothetical protein
MQLEEDSPDEKAKPKRGRGARVSLLWVVGSTLVCEISVVRCSKVLPNRERSTSFTLLSSNDSAF